jgi:4-hydroxybenzoate polyprenyltransferase
MKNNLLLNLLNATRPYQWSKNFFVLVALVFSLRITDIVSVIATLKAFIAFVLISSTAYIINDLADIEKDKKHPQKKHRPIAAGKINFQTALSFAVLLLVSSFLISWSINGYFSLIISMYLSIQIAYSFLLKKAVIIDVFCIALGFVLRLLGGAIAIGVGISSWFLLCAMMISLFLGFCKRRHELIVLGEKAHNHRPSLKKYSVIFLDQMIAVSTSITIAGYSLYTMADETIEKFQTNNLIYTIPFVIYGVFRYLYFVYHKGRGGSPEGVVFGDIMLKIDIILYIAITMAIIYFKI